MLILISESARPRARTSPASGECGIEYRNADSTSKIPDRDSVRAVGVDEVGQDASANVLAIYTISEPGIG